MIKPPENSKIRIETENGVEKIILPPPSGWEHLFFSRILIPVALLICLYGVVTLGAATVFSMQNPLMVVVFGTVWVGWLGFSVFLLWFFFKTGWKREPEMLLLEKPDLVYDSGAPSMRLVFIGPRVWVGADISNYHEKVWDQLFLYTTT